MITQKTGIVVSPFETATGASTDATPATTAVTAAPITETPGVPKEPEAHASSESDSSSGSDSSDSESSDDSDSSDSSDTESEADKEHHQHKSAEAKEKVDSGKEEAQSNGESLNLYTFLFLSLLTTILYYRHLVDLFPPCCWWGKDGGWGWRREPSGCGTYVTDSRN